LSECIYLTMNAYAKIWAYEKLIDEEFLTLLVINDDDGVIVEDVILPEQTVTYGSCTLDIGKTFTSIPKDLLPKIKGWHHSHSSMSVYLSAQDDEAIDNAFSHLPYCVSIVTNSRGDIKGYIDFFKPLKIRVEVDVKVLHDSVEDLEKEVKEKVKRKKEYTLRYKWDCKYLKIKKKHKECLKDINIKILGGCPSECIYYESKSKKNKKSKNGIEWDNIKHKCLYLDSQYGKPYCLWHQKHITSCKDCVNYSIPDYSFW